MKWIFLHVLFFSFSQLIGQGNLVFDLHIQDSSLKSVLHTIESDYDIFFSFREEDIADIRVSLNINTTDQLEFLSSIFKKTDLSFEIIESQYIIITKSDIPHVKAPPPTIKICGEVSDLSSGQPLPYANILLVGTGIGTSTDDDGKFELEIIKDRAQKIQVSYIGYISKSLEIADFVDLDCQKVYLDHSENEDLFILIKDYIADGVSLTQNGLSTKLSPKKIGALPGQIEPDILSTLQFIPGVNSSTSKASDIYIRGCTPDQNLLIWEDIPIYHSAHYFGMISAFNPFIIEEMNVFRGGFGAEYGGRIAGVVDLKSSDERNKDTYYGFGSNMTHAYAYAKHNFKAKRPTALTFSIRRSFSELLRTPTFDNITKFNQQGLLLGSMEIAALPDNIEIRDDFKFIDTHLKFSSQIGDKDRFEFSALYADNSFSDRISNNNTEQTQRDDMTLMNIGMSTKWQRQWSDQTSTELKVLGTSYDYAYEYDLEEEGSSRTRLSGSKSNMIQDKQVQLSANHVWDHGQEISGGYHLINYNIDFRLDERSRRGQDIREQGSSNSNLHSLFVTVKNPIAQNIGYSLGLRGSYFETNDKIYLEPRLNIAYRLTDRFSLHANYGRHHQFVSQITEFRGNTNGINTSLWALAENISVPVQVADIFQIGTIYTAGTWVVDVQAFKRNIEGLSSRAYEFETLPEGDPVRGNADIMGIDLLIKKRFSNFRTWFSYSLSRTNLNFRQVLPISFPADYDQRHAIQWSNQLDLSDLKLAIGLKASSGLPYSIMTDFDIISNSNEAFEYNAFYDGINDNNLPNQYEINLTASYAFKPKNAKWIGHISCSLSNIFNRENIFNRTFYVNAPLNRRPEIRNLEKTNLPITPNLSFRIEW